MTIPAEEEVNRLRELLSAHRHTAYTLRLQKALHSSAFVPPHVTHGIQEASMEIRRIKGRLRQLGVTVEDQYNDDVNFEALSTDTSPQAQAPKGVFVPNDYLNNDYLDAAVETAQPIGPRGPGGFFTSDGVVWLVQTSGLITNEERVTIPYLLFRTTTQRTWLIATTRQLFCVLDDEKRRRNGDLIQWHLNHAEANPIKTRPYQKRSGLVDIGPRRDWMYSLALHPDPVQLEQDIRGLMTSAKAV